MSVTADQRLIDEFVASFAQLDDLIVPAGFDVPPQMLAGWIDGFERWRPVSIQSDPVTLASMYTRFPNRFPKLYERLILSYRWFDVDLRLLKLLGNPPGATLEPLMNRLLADPVLVKVLLPKGYIPFATACDSYDPICFDSTRPTKHGDYPVVRFEHESILCNEQIGGSKEMMPTFRDAVFDILDIRP